jgi:uncharacterized membrane protein
MEKPSKETLEKWNQDPKNWKLGCLYFNPNDTRIFPPKRISGMGWTVNFANPKSVVAFLIMLSFILFIVYMINLNN